MKNMRKRYFFTKGFTTSVKQRSLVLLVLVLRALQGHCQEIPNGSGNIVYEPAYVPLPRGNAVEIGSLVLPGGMDISQALVTIQVNSATPLEGIRLTAKMSETESLILASDTLVEGRVGLRMRDSLPSTISQISLSVTMAANHDLRDRVAVHVESVTIGQQTLPIKPTRNIPPYRLATVLRTFGDDGVAAYRIPGLVTTPRGTLLAVYDIRRNSSRDLQGDIDVGLSRSTDGGRHWEPMRVIMDMEEWGGKPQAENGIGDPAVLVDPASGHIWVVALWGHGKPGEMVWWSSGPGLSPQETGQLMMVKSEDDGLTWSKPTTLTPGLKNPEWFLFFNGPGKGIALKDGTLVFPAQFKDKDKMPHSTVIYSKDRGKTWEVGTGARSNTTEAQVVVLSDGRWMLNMRDNRGGSRSVAITKDFGQTWTEHPSSRSALPEPVCMASLINHPSQSSTLLFSNPATEKGRYNMTIKASTDDGASWPEPYQLLLDEGTGWGYSCLTFIHDNEVGILYEGSVGNLVFQIIPLEDIIQP